MPEPVIIDLADALRAEIAVLRIIVARLLAEVIHMNGGAEAEMRFVHGVHCKDLDKVNFESEEIRAAALRIMDEMHNWPEKPKSGD